MATARSNHTATLLPDGRVLIAHGTGIGGNYLSSAEIYDPLSNSWSSTIDLSVWRSLHSATLMANGQVLLVGGSAGTSPTAIARLYDPGLGVSESRRPAITSVPVRLTSLEGQVLAFSGTALIGDAQSSSGSGSAANNLPVVKFRRLDNNAEVSVRADAMTSTYFHSAPLRPMAAGTYRMTVISDGVPSLSKFVTIHPADLNIMPIELPQATYGVAYTQTLSSDNGLAPYAFRIYSGSLPDLDFLSTGTLTGKPSHVGTYTFSVSVSDATLVIGPRSGVRTYSLVVLPTKPGAPTQVTVHSGKARELLVSFVPPVDTGHAIWLGYTATCSGNGVTRTAIGTSSPIAVGDLSYGVLYTCTVHSSSAGGESGESVAATGRLRRSNIAPLLELLW